MLLCQVSVSFVPFKRNCGNYWHTWLTSRGCPWLNQICHFMWCQRRAYNISYSNSACTYHNIITWEFRKFLQHKRSFIIIIVYYHHYAFWEHSESSEAIRKQITVLACTTETAQTSTRRTRRSCKGWNTTGAMQGTPPSLHCPVSVFSTLSTHWGGSDSWANT